MKSNKMTRVAGRKVGFGKVALPVWSLALAVAFTGAAAGQAVGPILSGSVSGEVGATVSQSITVDSETLGLNERIVPVNLGSGIDDFVAVTDDEGTHFTVAYENNTGDSATIRVFLMNRSDADAAAKLVLDVPANIDVELDSDGSNVEEAQISRNTWILSVTAQTQDDSGPTAGYIDLTIESKDDAKPGFYQISGRLTQIEG